MNNIQALEEAAFKLDDCLFLFKSLENLGVDDDASLNSISRIGKAIAEQGLEAALNAADALRASIKPETVVAFAKGGQS